MNKGNPRAREAGILLSGITGRHNAITDVTGVEVGYSTIIKGIPSDYKGPGSEFARTGVTAILPRGKQKTAVFAGRHDLNGNGEMTGTHWVDDSGFLHGPIMLTNTNSIGIVRDTTTKWMLDNDYYYPLYFDGQIIEGTGYFYPVVGETFDGVLNDTNGFHVKAHHVLGALANASSGPIKEGNVGGGTGMMCHEFKGGTGSSSRIVSIDGTVYTLGVLVQANHGGRPLFQISGEKMAGKIFGADPDYGLSPVEPGTGSIIVIIATDAPLLPHQISKLCRRAPIAIGALGSGYENGSGDIFFGFSTANENAFSYTMNSVQFLADDLLNPLYLAVAQATEEAILNALFAAETMEGKGTSKAYKMPQDQILDILKKANKAV